MKLFVSPHNDDEALFGAFTILRENPLVVVVFDSWNQWNRGTGITAEQRRAETLAAAEILGFKVEFMGFRDDEPPGVLELAEALKKYGEPEMVYAPAIEDGGNKDHNLVGYATGRAFQNVRRYLTYTTSGKSIGAPVPCEPDWVCAKIKALACYETQMRLPSTAPHFLRDQREWYVE